jgi:hypothetical protein
MYFMLNSSLKWTPRKPLSRDLLGDRAKPELDVDWVRPSSHFAPDGVKTEWADF